MGAMLWKQAIAFFCPKPRTDSSAFALIGIVISIKFDTARVREACPEGNRASCRGVGGACPLGHTAVRPNQIVSFLFEMTIQVVNALACKQRIQFLKQAIAFFTLSAELFFKYGIKQRAFNSKINRSQSIVKFI